MNQKILQRLIWKDARTLKPLAIATPVAIVGFFMLTSVFVSLSGVGDREQMSLSYAIWFLLPLLLAYGAPAVLIGGEEESGSLAWLQTLPASWRSIAGSKLLATTACLLLAWAVGTFCFMLYWSSIGDAGLDRMRRGGGLPEPFWLHFAGAFSLSVALMLSSFTTAYLIRSPITALIAVVPLMIAMAYGAFFLAFLTLPVEQQQSPAGGGGRATFMAIASSVLLAILLLLIMSFWAAWRRLARPESGLSQRLSGKFASDAFRPPQSVATSAFVGSMTAGRPKRLAALLWQQLCPIRWHLGLLTVAAIVGVLVTQVEVQLFASLGGLVSVLSVFVIASFTFYSDSVRKRCVFLSDRGISPTLVWLTRVGPTLLATIIISLVAAVVLMFHYSDVAAQPDGTYSLQWDIRITNWFAVGIASFALTQLVSQWSPRPTLAFFAGPVFVHFAAFALAGLFMFYWNATAVLFVSAAILLFASWRLMPQWMTGETGRGYVGPFLGYIALAVLLPYALVLGTRWITTPTERTVWRNQMLSMELTKPEDDAEKVAILNPAFVRRIEALATSSSVNREGQEDRIAQELAATETIGEHIAFKELLQIITRVPDYRLEFHQDFAPNNRSVYMTPKTYPDSDQYQSVRKSQFDAVRLLTKWSRITREQAVVGDATFYILFGVAENADLIASRVLAAYVVQQGVTPELSELVALMPDEKLVRLSRRNSFVRSWKNYQAIGGRFAGDYPRPPNQWWLAVERTRSTRYLDELTVAVLDQWDSGQDFRSPDALDNIRTFARKAYLDNPNVGSSIFYQNLDLSERLLKTVETDQLMSKLRRAVADATK